MDVQFWNAPLATHTYPSSSRSEILMYAVRVNGKTITCKLQAINQETLETKSFLGEMLYTSALQHPHILQPIYHTIWKKEECQWSAELQPLIQKLLERNPHTEYLFFIAMETALEEFFDTVNESKLSTEDQMVYTIQLLKMMYYLHSNRWIHGDFKFENILLFPNKHLKLIDFGNLSTIHTPSETIYSSRYTGPEREGMTQSLDLWALGVCIYILWTQRDIPWQGGATRAQIKLRQKLLQLPWLENYELPPKIKTVIYGLLQVCPEERWSAAEALYLFDPTLDNTHNTLDLALGPMNSHLRETILQVAKHWKRQLMSLKQEPNIDDQQLLLFVQQLFQVKVAKQDIYPEQYIKILQLFRQKQLTFPWNTVLKRGET